MLRCASLAVVVLVACGGPQGVPDGALAVVGERTFGPQDVAAVQAQLGAYAQLRFRGDEGKYALLQALVDAELLAQAAQDAGFADDPRIRLVELEEIAAVQRSSELERAVPRAEVEADTAALRAYYDAHLAEFIVPEQRSVQGVKFKTWADAEAALSSVRQGNATIESLGEVVRTQSQARDDHEFPGFHPVLFDEEIGEGDLLPVPVIVGQTLLVARLGAVAKEHTKPFDDPAVREALVEAVRAPKLAAARAARLAELATRFPEG